MSEEIIRRAWVSRTDNPTDRLVLVALADAADDSGNAVVPISDLAKRCAVSVRTVHRSLEMLLAQGHVSREGGRNSGAASRYCVTPLDDPDPVESETSVPYPEELRGRGGMTRLSHPGMTRVSHPSYPESQPGCDTVVIPPMTPVSHPPSVKSEEGYSLTSKEVMSQAAPATRPSKPRRKRSEATQAAAPIRVDIEEICSTLSTLLRANGFSKDTTVTDGWRKDARLLLDRDGIDLATALAVLRWSQRHKFWYKNIRSPFKFRKQFETLRAEILDEGGSLPLDRKSAEKWVRKCWDDADTKSITGRTGLEFQTPDIPDDVTDVPEFMTLSRRRWIVANKERIVEIAMRQEA